MSSASGAVLSGKFGMFRQCFDATEDNSAAAPSWFHQAVDEPDEVDEFPSLIRKVRSMEFASPLRMASRASLRALSSREDAHSMCSASAKFSHSRHHRPSDCGRLSRSTGSKASFLSTLDVEPSDSAYLHNDEQAEDDETNSMVTRLLSGSKLSIGCLSVILLACITFSNFAVDVAQARHLHRPDDSMRSARRKLGLGTAAISSVTSALSPILPFTGGVDLRREEHWDMEKGWFHSMSSMVDKVRDAFGLDPLLLESQGASLLSKLPRAGGQSSRDAKMRLTSSGAKRRKTERTSTLGTAKPFVSIDTISEMTLADLTAFFEYAIYNNRQDFQRSKFVNKASERIKPILGVIDAAIAKSRGKDVDPARTRVCEGCKVEQPLSPSVGYGDIDALQFCAAMRLFGEWRVVRQVPDGYKGFAVGMNLGHKDIVQNVAKIEEAAHHWIDYRRELIELQKAWEDSEGCPDDNTIGADDCELRSPTLRDLLEHEIDMDVHPRRPRLKDKTAAMGLLWVRRQLHYQTSLFANIVKVPKEYPTTNAAVSAAYSEVYGQYHGWAVQKIFNYSFQAAPDVEHIYKYMNPHRLKEALDEAGRFVSKALHLYEDEESDSDEEGTGMSPLERFANHVGSEWDKFVLSLSRVFSPDDGDMSDDLGMRGGSLAGDEHDHYVRRVMAQDAHEHILVYLESVNPLLKDLAGLFDDLNMDDPTKV